MLAFIFAPMVIALLALLFNSTRKYLNEVNAKHGSLILIILGVFLISGVFSIVVGFLLPNGLYIKRLLTRYGFYYLGIMLNALLGIGIAAILRIIIELVLKDKYKNNINTYKQHSVLFVILFTLSLSVYGIYNAHNLHVTNYDVKINKKADVDKMNVVLVSDLHLGYNVGLKQVNDMVNTINKCNPDVVIIAGDIFDNDYNALDQPEKLVAELQNIKAKYKYCVYGNHDVQEKILVGFTFNNGGESNIDERMIKFIDDSGFKTLYDSYEIVNGVYIYGRPDAHKINLGNKERKTCEDIVKDLDLTKPLIVIDHQPSELNKLASVGVDLDLCGHTHKGQVWPGTLTIKLFWDNAYGLFQVDNMVNIVTSGVGLFGPNMRTDSIAEVVQINVEFKK